MPDVSEVLAESPDGGVPLAVQRGGKVPGRSGAPGGMRRRAPGRLGSRIQHRHIRKGEEASSNEAALEGG